MKRQNPPDRLEIESRQKLYLIMANVEHYAFILQHLGDKVGCCRHKRFSWVDIASDRSVLGGVGADYAIFNIHLTEA